MGCYDKLEDMYINEKKNFDLVRRLEKYYFASLMDRDRLLKQIIPNLKVTLYVHSIIDRRSMSLLKHLRRPAGLLFRSSTKHV